VILASDTLKIKIKENNNYYFLMKLSKLFGSFIFLCYICIKKRNNLKYMKTVGVILARLQPIHNGHLALIKKASVENDEVHVFIGSADKFNERNPIPINIRKRYAESAVKEANLENVTFHLLDDLTNESDNSHDWGFYLYSKVVTEIQQSNFTIYYSDGFEIITSWFPGFILRNNVSLNLLARNATEEGISATMVRDMIVRNDPELEKVVPSMVYNERAAIKSLIELSTLKR
jgi:cytidyltransferase-like protein